MAMIDRWASSKLLPGQHYLERIFHNALPAIGGLTSAIRAAELAGWDPSDCTNNRPTGRARRPPGLGASASCDVVTWGVWFVSAEPAARFDAM